MVSVLYINGVLNIFEPGLEVCVQRLKVCTQRLGVKVVRTYTCEGCACVYVWRLCACVCLSMCVRVLCIVTILDSMQAVPPNHPVTPVGRRALEYYGYLLASFFDCPTLLPRPLSLEYCAFVCICVVCMGCASCVCPAC